MWGNGRRALRSSPALLLLFFVFVAKALAEGTHAEGTHAEDTHAEDTHAKDTHAENTHAEGTQAEDTHAKDTHAEDTHAKDTHAKDTHTEGTHAEDTHAEDTHAEDNESVVVTKQGPVRGTLLSSPSGPVTAFLGIPYGEPPVGALRFKKPVPVKPWPGVRDATKYGNTCYLTKDEAFPGFVGSEMWNPNTELSEDCLHLNVWVPSSRPADASVMVFIHGGGFETGTSTLDVYDGRILAQTEKVIVVSMNYRLGAFGFFALPGNPEVPGNAGLFDQQLALKWVQENIAAFGGNPNSVTLFGQSAGGASVSYHVFSPSSHPLFTRAIMESGSFNSPALSVSKTEARRMSLKLAQLLGCSHASETEVIVCLQAKSPEEINHNQNGVVGFAVTRFVPTVDGDFLSDRPDVLLKLGKFKQGEILTGVNKDEGSIFLMYGTDGISKDNESLITRAQLEKGVKMFFPEASELGLNSIMFQYTDWEDENNPEKNRDALKALVGDSIIVCPTVGLTKQMAEHGSDVFMYFFDHRSSQELWPEWAGVLHSEEIPFVFGAPLNSSNKYTKEEDDLSRKMMRFWANFARDGNPNGVGSKGNDWPLFTGREQKYLTMNTKPAQIKTKLWAQRCKFWDSYYPEVLKITGHCE